MNKVLWFTPTVGRGGVKLVVETISAAFAKYADKGEWKFDILGQHFDEVGHVVHYPKAWKFTQVKPLKKDEKLPPHPWQFEWLRENAAIFVEHLNSVADHYDLIFSPSPWWFMGAPNWTLTKPFVTVIPDFAFDHMVDMGLLADHFRHVARLVADRSTLTIFPSDFQRTHGEKFYGFKRTRTIPHSADFVASDYEPTAWEAERVREKYDLPEQYVLAFHAFGHKDILTILRAQHYARSNSPLVPPLVVAGIETNLYLQTRPEAHIQEVQRLIGNLGARPGIDLFILGHIPDKDVAGLHVGAKVAVQASRSEGDISGSSFNAIMARTPLIHSDLPVYRERFGEDNRYSLSFPVGDYVALGQAIMQACSQPEQSAQRALEAFGWARSRTVEDVAREYLDAFSGALNGG